jgi:predicted TIM-barrel fold metal-dependent hydrolase
MLAIYEEVMKRGLLVVMHTGYDIAFERIRRADPKQVLHVHDRFPELKFVTTHLGAWEQWDEVRELIIGKPIYMEISFSMEYLDEQLKEMVQSHPEGYVLFGSDEGATLERLRALNMAAALENALFLENAVRLLDSV